MILFVYLLNPFAKIHEPKSGPNRIGKSRAAKEEWPTARIVGHVNQQHTQRGVQQKNEEDQQGLQIVLCKKRTLNVF